MEDSVEDLFSNLPDEILSCVVSFVPKEYVLETSLISTRWRDLWNKVLVRHGTKEDIPGVVAGFLTRFEELDPLKHPRRLQFHFAEDSSVLLATIATNSKFLLDFSAVEKDERSYELHFKLSTQQQITNKPSFMVKKLYLKSVSNLTSEVVSSIVSNLEHLQNLVIMECSGLKSLFIESESKLDKLNISDCLQLKSLHLRTSKLKSFQYHGPCPLIWPESHFNLSDATLDFRLGPCSSDIEARDFNQTLLTIKNSHVLTLCKWTFEALIWPRISPLCLSFTFYRLRELWWIDNHVDKSSINVLLSFLKLCPALEQLFVTIDPKSFSAPRSNSWLMHAAKYTELEHEHLKLIKFVGFTNQVDEISVAKKLIKVVKGKPPKIETSDGSYLDAVYMQ